jgi:hypothetical protein
MFLRADSAVLLVVMVPGSGCGCGCFCGMISAVKAWKISPHLDVVFLSLQAEEMFADHSGLPDWWS